MSGGPESFGAGCGGGPPAWQELLCRGEGPIACSRMLRSWSVRMARPAEASAKADVFRRPSLSAVSNEKLPPKPSFGSNQRGIGADHAGQGAKLATRL